MPSRKVFMTDFLKIYEKFKTITEEKQLIGEGDAVLAAVSGGRDSTALLLLLNRLAQERSGFYLGVFHFNHCLRGDESDGDEQFVKDLGGRLGLDCFTERGDVKGYAEENRLSIETAARDLRYAALRKCAENIGIVKGKRVRIAVAHTAEDRAETVFLNIVRGTSVDGLEGIKYENGDVIRPLLDLTKDDVEMVCRECGSGYRTDSTNFMKIGKRNVARLDVFPYINGQMDCDITERLLSLSKLAADDSDFISKEADRAFEKGAEVKGGDVKLFPEVLNPMHPSLKSRVIRKAISLAGRDGVMPFKDCVSVSTDMVERTAGFLKGGSGTLELGKDVYCVGAFGSYVITVGKPEKAEKSAEALAVRIPADGGAEYRVKSGLALEVKVSEGHEIQKAVRRASESCERVAVFDLGGLEKIISESGELVLRCPEEGDRIRPFGAGGGKSLGKFLTDRKIRAAERVNLRILASGNNVLHVFGLRRSDAAPVNGDTQRCVSFELKS